MEHWYNLDEQTRIKEIYSKYTIEDFWKFWCEHYGNVMEVRIPYKIAKEYGTKNKLPYSTSGVYVNKKLQLKKLINALREKTTMWFGINPRKKNWSRGFNNRFPNYGSGEKGGSSDENISNIQFIFIDIDRVIKDGNATNEDLKNCNILADRILDRLSKAENQYGIIAPMNRSYCKICSGNGLQLIIKLDERIKLPYVEFDNDKKIFKYNSEFEQKKNLIKQSIGKQLLNFSNKFKDELGVEVDKTCFNMGRVGALPFTKNFKHDSFRWRGIVELKDDPNYGLTDYCYKFLSDNKFFRTNNLFRLKDSPIEHRIKPGQIKEHTLVKFMLENEFPNGGINNTLWMSLKCLLRDSKIDLTSAEFIVVHRELCQKHKRTFTLNIPSCNFNEATVNNYCIQNLIPPLYEPYSNRNNNLNFDNIFIWKLRPEFGLYELKGEDIQEDMKCFRDELLNKPKELYHIMFSKFLNGCIKKYGEEKTKYYFEYLFKRGIGWK